jgi:hypothetical protein
MVMACLASILSSIIVMGNARYLRDDDVMLGTFFIVFPAALLLLLLVLPRTALGDPRRWVKVPAPAEQSPHSQETMLWMWALGLVGACGIHRLVAGRVATGVIWICTGGLFGVGQLIDLVLILTGNFTDAEGRRVMPPSGLVRAAAAPAIGPAAGPAGAAAPLPPSPNGPAADPACCQPDQPGIAGGAAASVNTPVPPYVPPGAEYPSLGVRDVARSAGSYGSQSSYVSYRQKAADAAAALVAGIGMLLVFLALLASLATSLYPLLALAGFVDPGFGAMVKEQLARNPKWCWMVYQVGVLVAAVLWLSGVTALLLGRRRRGLAHMARGGIGALFLGLGLMPMHVTLEEARVWNLTQPQAAADVLPRLLGLDVTLPMALIFFAAIVLLVWPARRAQPAHAAPAAAPAGA